MIEILSNSKNMRTRIGRFGCPQQGVDRANELEDRCPLQLHEVGDSTVRPSW